MSDIDPESVNREFDATLEACGRAMGFCLSLILDRGVKTGEALSDGLDTIAYDHADRLDPRTRAVLLGILEGLSVAMDGDEDARL